MRPFLRSLLLLLAWGTWLSPGNVQAQGTAFSCDGVFYQIRLVNNTSQIFKVDRSTANYSTTPLNIIGGTSNDLGVSINGLAYNPQDGYMYGLSTPGNSAAIPTSVSLYKIGMGGIINLGVVKVGTANLQLIVASGTFDKTGNYYFSSQNTGTADNNLYTINIPSNPLAATAKAFSATSTFYDIAYNPIDNFLYGVNWVGSLFKIDQATATVTTIAPPTTQTTSQAVGTLFFDVSGTLFAYNNGTVGTANSATFYQVDLTDGSYTPISSISPASVSDGASCINPDQRIDVTKELTNVVAVNSTTFDITYTIRVRNSATATDDFVQVSDLLFGTTAATKANTTFPTASSVTVQGVPVVTNLDGSGLTANTSFTGVSGNASLLDGTHGLTASQRAAITYTVRVVYASGSVPNATTSQNNTAYATSTSASPNRGYIQASDGTLLTPNDLEANDASTNSNDYPALRLTRTDTPSPTPVTFAPSISGTVFEDVNYGGGLGRSRLTSTGIGRNGARVELYTVTGVVATYATSTTTDINGNYSFTGLNAGTSYVVRVVNSSVTSSRGTGGVAVQTYRTTVTAANGTTPDLNRVGGEVPSQADAGNGTIGTTLGGLALANTPAESQAPVSFATVASPAVNVDFGYNFDVIVNNNDAGQGSFRQFIANSNALGGETSLAQVYTPTTGATTALRPGVETSIFMIPNGTAVAGQRANLTNEFATTTGTSTATTITLNSTITGGITGPLTVIDGSTQTRSTGNTNAAVATTGSESTGPEVIINFNGSDGLTTTAASTSLLNMGLTGATPTGGSTTAAFSIFNTGATNAVVQNNTFYTNGANLRINGVGGANISNNISRNAQSINSDGIEVSGSSNNTIANNQFLNNAGFGIDFIQGTSTGNNITGNTFSRNGQNTDASNQTAGIGFRSVGASNNTVSSNTFTTNKGDGITAISGLNNTFSQNSFSNNGDLAIDLASGTAGGDGVTLNAAGTRTGANNLLNFPILTTANIGSTNLVLNGYARPGVLVELYLAAADPTGFGEGATYLTNFTQGTAVGTVGNVTTGAVATYGTAAINGLSQGTDNTNTFTVTIPLASLSPTLKAALQSGTAILTSTATLTNTGTSEFSGNLALPVADVTVAITGPTTLSANQATGTYTATFTNEGPNDASTVTRTVALPAGASLSTAQQNDLIARYNLTAASFTTPGGITTINFGSVASLAANASSVVTFAFTAPTTVSNTLTLAANTTTASSEGANNAPDQATLTLSTVTIADVQVTSITPSSTATTGKFDVVFGNNGPQTANGVVYTVQLPAGLGTANVAATNGGSYDNATGIVSYAGAANSLSSGGTFASAITYALNAAPAAPVVATASVSTTTDEAGITANNVKSATMAPLFDLTTTLTGPTTAIAGSPTTLYVTTTNNGPNTAGNATQTVTIPSAASLAGSIYITNGGTYSYNGTTGTVTFPTLTNLPGGQTVTNSISFLPTGTFAPTAAVTTTSTTETVTTNNTANLNNGASGASITVNTSATLANEATTIVATVGATTTPATIVSPGSVVTYTVTSTNKGYPAVTPTATVTQQVQLLPGLTAATLTVGGKTATGTTTLSFAATNGITSTYDPTTGVLTYSNVTETSGSTTTYPAIAVTVPAAIGNNGQLVATATVSTNLQDNVPADNIASAGVRVTTKPDLVATISGPSSTVAGLPATYVVRFANNGATGAITVTETAQLPAGLSNVTVADASGFVINGAYNSTTGQVTFISTSPLAAGGAQLFTISLAAPAQTFPVIATIATATADGIPTNNAASLITTVTPNADLAVNISGPATAVIGNPVTYIVTTTNNGPTTASNAVTQLQLPKNLADVDAGTATYTASTGLLTFPATTTLTAGNSVVNYVTFTMPSATAAGDPAVNNGAISAVASIRSSGTTDAVAGNNSAGLTTSAAPATSAVADLATTISLSTPTGSPTSVAAGTVVTYTATYGNTAGSTATNVVGTANLPTGLSAATLKVGNMLGNQVGTVITFPASAGLPAGSTYDTTTGLLTFPTFATLPVSTSSNSYSISFPAPVGSGQLTVYSEITSATTEATTAIAPNTAVQANRSSSSISINTNYDVATTLAGPANAQPGTTNTYTVTSLNNGPSATSTSTTQTVTLPAGVTVTNISGNGLQSSTTSGTTITWPIPAGQAAGVANEVVNSFSAVMPATGDLRLTARITSTGEAATNPVTNADNTLNNTDGLTTNSINIAPVAQNVWNTLQSARSNDANTAAPIGLPISPLSAADTEPAGSIGGYTIVTVPDATQGKLYYNGSTTALTNNTTGITDPSKLTFAPTPGYVGNATFTYFAIDNGNGSAANTLPSPIAIYTIPVAADQEAPAYTPTVTKGGSKGAYVAGDVIAYTFDPNVANFGATGVVYAADGKTLNTNANNGITSATTNGLLTKGAMPGVATLSDLGLAVDANGRLVVNDPGTLASPKLRAGSYSVVITTIDANGGVTTQSVDFTIPANPLPVVLTAFTATAVQNRDAQLSWTTASEENSAYFDIERSFDGVSFAKVGQVAAHGTTTQVSTYAFTDAGVAARATGAVYYRLKQVDLDATANFSPVRTVSFTKTASVALSLYPNPAQSATTLDLSQLPATGTYHVLVLDATGRQVRVANLGGGIAQSLALHELATGTYFVVVTGTLADGSALRQTLRLTKE